MDNRAQKLTLARKKLRDHQDKKLCLSQNHNNVICVDSTKHNLQSDIYQLPDEIQDHVEENITVKSNVTQSDCQHEQNSNVVEILISNKQTLELQIMELQSKYSQLELNFTSVFEKYNKSNQRINDLEKELQTVSVKNANATQDIILMEQLLQQLNVSKSSLLEEKSNLHDQLEFTKNILTTKEVENNMLLSQLNNLQNELEGTKLQLQQITNGFSPENSYNNTESLAQKQNEELNNKLSILEKQIKVLQKDKEQISMHYEHYVSELNEQLKTVMKQNDNLKNNVHDLTTRESSLIDQISDMEIRLQHVYSSEPETTTTLENLIKPNTLTNYQQNYEKLEGELLELREKYEQLQKLNAKINATIVELTENNESDCSHDKISISKLNADITSDKIAAQRATEQNRKLKQDMHGLEDAFVKMSTDKLELTEKLSAEKFLNRELTIKLAEIEEKTKDMFVKLKAKDDEMIRLQSSYRDMESKLKQVLEDSSTHQAQIEPVSSHSIHPQKKQDIQDENEKIVETCVIEEYASANSLCIDRKESIPKDDAMTKLQDRFLKIMDEVANLSDEKHRLEHIILQLQNETDTICEYVALYQQQRNLLKKRDEERSAQIKMFQIECDKLKSHINELSEIFSGFEQDKELVSYFQEEPRRRQLERAINLLSDLRNSSLIDSKRNNIEFKNFYPCACCSGQLIDV